DITLPTPIEIGTQPESQTVEEGRRVTLSVTLTNGSPPLTYQWFKDGNSIPNATNRIYRITNAQTDLHSGTYYVEITNPLGTVQSEFATLTVIPDETAPSIISANSLDGTKIKVLWS